MPVRSGVARLLLWVGVAVLLAAAILLVVAYGGGSVSDGDMPGY
jgi:hypothetical protein